MLSSLNSTISSPAQIRLKKQQNNYTKDRKYYYTVRRILIFIFPLSGLKKAGFLLQLFSCLKNNKQRLIKTILN